MVSSEERRSFGEEFREGWRAAIGASLGIATGSLLFVTTSGLFVRPLSVAFHWSRGQIGAGAALNMLAVAAAPAAGWLSDRFGVRPVSVIGLLSLAASLAGLSTMKGSIAEYYGWLCCVYVLGAGSTSIVLSRPIAIVFRRFRGAALGLGLGLSALAIMVITPALQAVIAIEGWRAGYLALACAPGVLGVGAVLLCVWRPAPAGDGRPAGDPSHTLTGALRDKRFWLMFFGMLTANLYYGGLLGQLPALLGDRGMTAGSIGLLMSVMTASTVLGRVLNGFALDRYSPPLVACVFFVIPIFGLLLLQNAQIGFAATLFAVVLVGLSQGAESTILSFFTARIFGLGTYSTIYGTLAVAITIAFAVGGAMFGMIYDRTGSYDWAIWIAAAGLATAALCFLLTPIAPVRTAHFAPLPAAPSQSQ